MNSASKQHGLTEETYKEKILKMFDNTNIYVLLELYYRETSFTNDSEFVRFLTKYLRKYGKIT